MCCVLLCCSIAGFILTLSLRVLTLLLQILYSRCHCGYCPHIAIAGTRVFIAGNDVADTIPTLLLRVLNSGCCCGYYTLVAIAGTRVVIAGNNVVIAGTLCTRVAIAATILTLSLRILYSCCYCGTHVVIAGTNVVIAGTILTLSLRVYFADVVPVCVCYRRWCYIGRPATRSWD